MIAILLLLASTEVENAECKIGCVKEGYDGGQSSGLYCICFEYWEKSHILQKKIKLPKLNKSTSEPVKDKFGFMDG